MTFEKRSVTIRGETYGSVKEAADAHGVSVSAVSWAIKRGAVDAIGTGSDRSRPITIEGRTFPSYRDLANHLGVQPSYIGKYLAVKAAIEAKK